MDFQDLNKACPKTTSPHPSLTRLSMSVWEEKYFPSWMDFLDTIRFRSSPRINTRQLLYVLGGLSHIKNAFWPKNVGATFQWAMSFSFHDLKHIVEAYLDDLTAHSHKRVDHPTHLRLIFKRCHYYHIQVEPK
jgi:hypothetical protein